jgi:hypothetical protein
MGFRIIIQIVALFYRDRLALVLPEEYAARGTDLSQANQLY